MDAWATLLATPNTACPLVIAHVQRQLALCHCIKLATVQSSDSASACMITPVHMLQRIYTMLEQVLLPLAKMPSAARQTLEIWPATLEKGPLGLWQKHDRARQATSHETLL